MNSILHLGFEKYFYISEILFKKFFFIKKPRFMMIIWLSYHTQSKKYFLKKIFQEINFMGQTADALQPKREANAV